MENELRVIEKDAINAQRRGDHQAAIALWLRLISTNSDWEHGYAHYYLANSYSSLHKFNEAEAHYAEAMRIEPNDTLFSEALSSLIAARSAGLK